MANKEFQTNLLFTGAIISQTAPYRCNYTMNCPLQMQLYHELPLTDAIIP